MKMIQVIKNKLKADAELHWLNFETYINNPTAIGEHGSIVETAIEELEKAVHYDDLLACLTERFQENEQLNS